PPSAYAQQVKVNGLEPTQTERRFDLIELDRFRYSTSEQIAAWTAHLIGVEQHLRLMNATPGMLSDGAMPEYLYRRTNGVVGLLERLLEDGCREAIETGDEKLTESLLDNVVLRLPGSPERDPAAGEVPELPPQPTRRGKRSRNTVFDDHGPAAAGESR
ncbi:hypothetical protein ACGFJ2_59210, partial [Nonomuraea sp. NPDC049028]